MLHLCVFPQSRELSQKSLSISLFSCCLANFLVTWLLNISPNSCVGPATQEREELGQREKQLLQKLQPIEPHKTMSDGATQFAYSLFPWGNRYSSVLGQESRKIKLPLCKLTTWQQWEKTGSGKTAGRTEDPVSWYASSSLFMGPTRCLPVGVQVQRVTFIRSGLAGQIVLTDAGHRPCRSNILPLSKWFSVWLHCTVSGIACL